MNWGPAVAVITLDEEEEIKLQELARQRKTGQAMALRCRIVLDCAKGRTNTEIAKALKISLPTVGKWRQRFGKLRMAGLADVPRPGQPRKITDAMVEQVVTQTLESKPEAATQWSTRSMARKTGWMQNAIHRIWKTFLGSNPICRTPSNSPPTRFRVTIYTSRPPRPHGSSSWNDGLPRSQRKASVGESS